MTIIEKTYNWSGSLTTRAATKYIILHHRAGNGSVESIHTQHLSQGYTGIGYHFYVRKDGSVYRGRPIDKAGAHCKGSNSIAIGVCFEGNFETETMPTAQLTAGRELIAYLQSIYPNAEVKQHKNFNSTACPGRRFPFEEVTSMTLENAIKIIQNKAGLASDTVKFLLCYKYGEELIIKLAKAMRK